jgi:hypothetical protein
MRVILYAVNGLLFSGLKTLNENDAQDGTDSEVVPHPNIIHWTISILPHLIKSFRPSASLWRSKPFYIRVGRLAVFELSQTFGFFFDISVICFAIFELL